jgi:hypothetical protein
MDRSLAVLLGKISSFVYKPSAYDLPDIDEPSVKMFQDPGPFPCSYAAVLRYPDKTVLVFQRSIIRPNVEAVRDWLANFSAVLVSALQLPGLVHLGYADQLRLIRDDVWDDLNSGFTPPLYLTGHSQGGAVAVLAAKALELAGIEVTATYTFAAPLPGDDVFAASVKTPVFRFEYGDDIVPHYPLHSLSLPLERALKSAPELSDLLGHISTTLGYVPAGKLTYGAPGQPLLVDLSRLEEKALTLKRLPRLATAGVKVFEHHNIANYVNMLL